MQDPPGDLPSTYLLSEALSGNSRKAILAEVAKLLEGNEDLREWVAGQIAQVQLQVAGLGKPIKDLARTALSRMRDEVAEWLSWWPSKDEEEYPAFNPKGFISCLADRDPWPLAYTVDDVWELDYIIEERLPDHASMSNGALSDLRDFLNDASMKLEKHSGIDSALVREYARVHYTGPPDDAHERDRWDKVSRWTQLATLSFDDPPEEPQAVSHHPVSRSRYCSVYLDIHSPDPEQRCLRLLKLIVGRWRGRLVSSKNALAGAGQSIETKSEPRRPQYGKTLEFLKLLEKERDERPGEFVSPVKVIFDTWRQATVYADKLRKKGWSIESPTSLRKADQPCPEDAVGYRLPAEDH